MDISSSNGMPDGHPAPFAIVTRDVPDLRVVRFLGELDVIAADRVTEVLRSAVDSGSPVIADCAAVTFSSSAVLGVFYATHVRATKSGTRFVLVTNARALLRPLDLLGLLDAMTVVPDMAAALAELELWELEPRLTDHDR
ncbi:STAS domain-containing protein [Lentzea sp. NPDC058450]|uniref:STAS domain-containing protein n=1 Tax=Lentzea sp. NPDC058450 TaxID=3346505 RepID=UPI003661666A